MTKLSVALAVLLVLGSAMSNVAFAATNGSQSAVPRGQAVNECRANENPSGNDHHARLAVDACVQRLMAGAQATTNQPG